MRSRARSFLLRWAPLLTLAATGCGVPAYSLSDLQIPVRTWEAGQVESRAGQIFASNKDGAALLTIDPATLDWKEVRQVRGLIGFDPDRSGVWTLERRSGEKKLRFRGEGGVDRIVEAGEAPEVHWTRDHLVLWSSDACLTVVKGDGPDLRVEHHPGLRLLGVDSSTGTLWATRDRTLLARAAGETGWRVARLQLENSSLQGEDLLDRIEGLCFGKARFAFHMDGLIYWGRTAEGELRVERAIDLPGAVERIRFNSGDEDCVLAWTETATWAWDLVAREGVRLPLSEALSYDPRRRSGVQLDRNTLRRVPGDDPPVTILLDGCAVTVNGLWRLIACPIDFSIGTVMFLTPAGLLFQQVGLARSVWR